MSGSGAPFQPQVRTRAVLTLAAALVLAALAVYCVPRVMWMNRELANILLLNEEARRLGGCASTLAWSDYSADGIHVLLELTGPRVDDAAFAHLAAMPAFRHTRLLSLAGSRVTDASIRLLEDGPLFTAIDLSGTRITDAGMTSIGRFRWANTFNLRDTTLTDAGVDALIESWGPARRAASIDVTGTKVTAAGASRLASVPGQISVMPHPTVLPADPGSTPAERSN